MRMLLLPLLAFLLGLKHSYDADHLIAVSNLLTRTRSVKSTVRMSASWAVGHMLTASIITILLYQFRGLYQIFLTNLELLVPIMLILIGAIALKGVGLFHRHEHSHGGEAHTHRHVHLRWTREQHYHKHMFGIGIVHGLASNDELLILFTVSLSLTSLSGILLGISIFSVGVVAGMVSYGIALNYPLRRFGSEKIRRIVSAATAIFSITYGTFLLVPF